MPLARILITLVLVSSVVASFILDWSPNHLLNPLWHPHAKFHGALLLFTLAGVCLTSLWGIWRQSEEMEVAIRLGALVALSYWTPLFYITTLLPGSSSWAGDPLKDPRLSGSLLTPNLPVAAVFILISLFCFWLTFQSPRRRGALPG